jgi:uncharacterized protein (DUF1697 family)
MARQIALLRGVNVGGRRRLEMAALRALLGDAGYEGVRTYLQSGNVVLTSDSAPDALQRDLERRIADGLGVASRVIVRSRDELAEVIERNPLRAVADDPKRHTVYFLSGAPDAGGVRQIAAADIGAERFAVSGREIHTWHPGGIQHSPLARLLTEQRLGVGATARNWNTVTKLLALADE